MAPTHPSLAMCKVMVCRADLTEHEIRDSIARRAEARKAKDYAAADQERLHLAARGILIMDSPTGSTWRPGIQE